MANLIITIISIALVAVAAIMGAYYGGAAFQEGQVKAQASTIISLAQQIKAAHLAYRAAGGAPIITQTPLHTSSNYLVNNGYLSGAMPADTNVVTAAKTGRYNVHTITENGNIIGERILLSDVKKSICEQIVQIATGSKELRRFDSVTPDATWNAYKDSNGLGMLDGLKKYPFDCYYRDLNGDSVFDETAGESSHFHMLLTLN